MLFEKNLELMNEDQSISLPIQSFSRWVSLQLSPSLDNHFNYQHFFKDFLNGKTIIKLATKLTHEQQPQNAIDNPTNYDQMLLNCQLGLQMFSKDGINVDDISSKEIADGNEKQICAFIWSLIIRYQIDQSHNIKDNSLMQHKSNSSIKSLIQWAKNRIQGYPHIRDFFPFELTLCALLDSYYPNIIQYDQLDPNDTQNNLKLAIQAMKTLSIPIFLNDDISKNHINPKVFFLQVSSMKTALDAKRESTDNFDENGSNDNEKEKLEKEINDMGIELMNLQNKRYRLLQNLYDMIGHDKQVIERLNQALYLRPNNDHVVNIFYPQEKEYNGDQKKQIEELTKELKESKDVIRSLSESIMSMQRSTKAKSDADAVALNNSLLMVERAVKEKQESDNKVIKLTRQLKDITRKHTKPIRIRSAKHLNLHTEKFINTPRPICREPEIPLINEHKFSDSEKSFQYISQFKMIHDANDDLKHMFILLSQARSENLKLKAENVKIEQRNKELNDRVQLYEKNFKESESPIDTKCSLSFEQTSTNSNVSEQYQQMACQLTNLQKISKIKEAENRAIISNLNHENAFLKQQIQSISAQLNQIKSQNQESAIRNSNPITSFPEKNVQPKNVQIRFEKNIYSANSVPKVSSRTPHPFIERNSSDSSSSESSPLHSDEVSN